MTDCVTQEKWHHRNTKLRVWPEGSWIQTQFKCEENGFMNRSAPHKTTWNFESTEKQIGLVSRIACGESRSNLCSRLKRSRHASSILRDFYSKPGIELRWSLVSVEFEKPKNLLYCSVNGYFCGNFTSNKEQCVALKISARFGFFSFNGQPTSRREKWNLRNSSPHQSDLGS